MSSKAEVQRMIVESTKNRGEIRQEDKRIKDATEIESDDEDFKLECENDELQPYIDGEKDIKVKITTSPEFVPSMVNFAKSLEKMIPNSTYVERENYPLKTYIKDTIDEGYSDLLLLTKAREKLYSMIHIHLPNGPCAEWRVTSVLLPHEIVGRASYTDHYPDVVTLRFTTFLGHMCSRMLRALFPAKPQHEGRKVVSFVQQRDFVFCRSYKYAFMDTENVNAQELGPRFTLRLLSLMEGPYDPANGNYTFFRRTRNDKDRLKWYL